MKGIKRQHGTLIPRNEPITFSQINDVAESYNAPIAYDDALFLALLTIAFFGLLRIGKLTDPNDTRLINRRKSIRRDSLTMSHDSVSFILPASKNDKSFAGNDSVLVKTNGSPNDPVVALSSYVRQRDQRFQSEPYLWITSQGSPPTRRWFLSRFHRHFDTRHGEPSMRAGGVTLLAKRGVSFDIIQAIGRWSSEAFRTYIRTHSMLLHSIAAKQ